MKMTMPLSAEGPKDVEPKSEAERQKKEFAKQFFAGVVFEGVLYVYLEKGGKKEKEKGEGEEPSE